MDYDKIGDTLLPRHPAGLARLLAAIEQRSDPLHPFGQCFQSERYGFFDVVHLEKAYKEDPSQFKEVGMPLDDETGDWLTKTIGIDRSYCAKLSPQQLATPGFAVMIPHESPCLVVDGHHRAYARWKLGLPIMPIRVACPEVSRACWFFPGTEDLPW